LGAVLAVMASLGTASAATNEELQKKLDTLQKVVVQQGKRIASQDKKIAELQKKNNEAYLKKVRRESVLAVLKEMNIDARKRSSGGWLENFTVYGDLRLRYHLEKPDDSTPDMHRGRFRLRVGVRKTWWEKQMEVGFRLASGSSDDPTSTNQTWTGNFSEKRIWIDLAYAKYTPNAVKGAMIVGGKMKNPFVHTNMIWDSDVNPEGVWGEYRYPGFGPFEPFGGFGFFQLVHNSDDHDAELHAYQVGFRWKVIDGVKWTCALAYYDFGNFEDDNFSDDANGNTVNAAGDRLTAEEFNVLNLTNKVSWAVFSLPMSAYIDYAHNCGNILGGQSDAFAVSYKVGKNKKKGDWSVEYKYAYIEANSTPGRFNDSTFGFSNRKGHQWGAAYNIADFITAGLKLFCTEPVNGAHEDNTAFLLLADLIWKF